MTTNASGKLPRKELTPEHLQAITERLAENRPVRRALLPWGRIHIDRQLPFLCIHRRPAGGETITAGLLVAEAAYLLASGRRKMHARLAELVRRVADIMVDRFGALLLVEVWAMPHVERPDAELPPRPAFQIFHLHDDPLPSILSALRKRLGSIAISRQHAKVTVTPTHRIAPPGLAPLLPASALRRLGCHLIGLAVKPIYIDHASGEAYPFSLRALKRQLRRALDQAFYEFSIEHTTHQPVHYYALGRHAVVKAVWQADRRLAAVSNSFDFLWQVTPVNAAEAWREFRRHRFERTPAFLYRPRPMDPGRMKKVLYDIHIDRIEDPTLMQLFLDKQMELDRQLTMLQDLGRREFLYGSMQLYGEIKPSLLRIAEQILGHTPPRSMADVRDGYLSPARFARRARAEFAWYRRRAAGFKASVEIRDDLYAGLMVSRGRLLIGKETRVPARRAEALIQHEVGTHLVTYYNGQAQPFRMLYTGLPGYDELQEGLAVLAEYLVGGLSATRLRILAARVLASSALAAGASFVEVYRLLAHTHAFPGRTAFTITMRVFRGGGLTKDAIYLRGFISILDYLAAGGDFERLLVGKIGEAHLPVVEELLLRNVLKPPPLHPRYLEREETRRRLAALRQGVSVIDLIPRRKEHA